MAAADSEQIKYKFRFYMSGETDFNKEVIAVVRSALDEKLPGRYELEVIDVLDQDEIAREDGIMATPTLAKIAPPPVRKFFGRLASRERVAAALAAFN